MATVDLSRVQFLRPPPKTSCSKPRPTSHVRKYSSLDYRNQPASLYNKGGEILKSNEQLKSAAAATRHQGYGFVFQQGDDVVGV